MRAERIWHLREVLEPGAAKEALDTAGDVDADGWRETTIRVESQGMAIHELLRFGSNLEVLEPTELRDAMAAQAAEMVERYATSA